MAGSPYDSALELRAEANIGATATTTAIDVEGGSEAEIHLMWQTPTGTSPTLQVDLEVSVDAGSTYVKRFRSRVFVAADAPASYESYAHYSFPVWIPRPTAVDSYRGSLPRAKARIVSTVGGTTPVFPNFRAFLGIPVYGYTRERSRV